MYRTPIVFGWFDAVGVRRGYSFSDCFVTVANERLWLQVVVRSQPLKDGCDC